MPPDEPTTEPDLLFVYGTLKSTFHNAPAQSLRRSAQLIGPAWVQGRMFAVSGPRGALRYPAVVPSEDPRDVVTGELYRLLDRRVIELLDAYEGCAASSPPPHEYARSVVQVTAADGARLAAFIYWYAHATGPLLPIPGGVFPPPA